MLSLAGLHKMYDYLSIYLQARSLEGRIYNVENAGMLCPISGHKTK